MSSSTSNNNGHGNGNGAAANAAAVAANCPFSNEGFSREPSRFSVVVQRVENCLTSMHRINEQISSLAEQRRKIQDELRGIQVQINEEFERILNKPARSIPTKVVARAVKAEIGNGGTSMKMEVAPRIEELEGESPLARAAS